MRRLLLIGAIVGMVVLAGCGDVSVDTDPIEAPPSGASDADAEPPGDDEHADSSNPIEGELEIHHIDVGQADSTLLITPAGETILVDTGDWRGDGSNVIEYLDDREIDRIDHLIGTHGHADHIGGHAAIIEEFETNREGIGAVYDSGVTHTSLTYENYLDAVEEHDTELLVVEEGDALPIDDDALSGRIVNPPAGETSDDLHDNSVAIVFEYGDVRYLTTGDAETETEARMLDRWADDLDVDVYQAGHHGSSTSSSSAFLDATSPSIAIVSSAFDSQYGHPHEEVLDAFADRGIETYWTAVHGDIVLTTDGSDVAIETSEEFSSDPVALLEEKPDDGEDSYSLASPTSPMAAGG